MIHLYLIASKKIGIKIKDIFEKKNYFKEN